MVRLLVRLFFAAIFFLLASTITLAIMWGVRVVFGQPLHPTLWWLTGPIMGALAGLRYGGQFDVEAIIAGMGRRQRQLVGFSALWAFVCIVVFSVFDPFSKYRWEAAEWGKFLIIVCGPVVVGLLAGRVSRWASAGRTP